MTAIAQLAQVFSGIKIEITGLALSDSVIHPSTAVCSLTVRRDGNMTTVGSGSGSPPSDEWADPDAADVGDDYEVRMVTGTGSSVGTMDTWQALTSNRTWSLSQAGVGSDTGSHTLEIRRAGGSGAAIDSATMTFTATVDAA